MDLIKDETHTEISYKNMGTEMQRMWNTKALVTTVINGTTEIVTEGQNMYLEITPGKQFLCKKMYWEHHKKQ
jgi:hypothetical protein